MKQLNTSITAVMSCVLLLLVAIAHPMSAAVSSKSLAAQQTSTTTPVTFTFEDSGIGANIEYGSLDPQGFQAYIRDGFVIDVKPSSGINGLLHWHETDSVRNDKVPDRSAGERGVLLRDSYPGKDPLFFAPVNSNTTFSLERLVVGTTSADGAATTGVLASAFLQGQLLATVILATPVDGYAPYSGAGLGALSGLKMDRLEFIGLSSNQYAYYMLDNVVLDVKSGGLSIMADTDHVWANGHQETKLTVREVDASGQGVSGHQIQLSADPANGVTIKPINDTTDQNGEAVFTATSTEVGTVNFTATDANLTASTTVEFQRRKIVVQVLGIRTNLACDPATGECIPNDPNDPRDNSFKSIRGLLTARGFEDSDFLWYSYQGGTVDQTTGQWKANSYICENTAQDYRLDIELMRVLLQEFGQQNPNTDFYLVGHSQGGLIAFQALSLLNNLSLNTKVESIITMDSPLGGVPPQHSSPLNFGTCWRGQAAGQLNELYRTVPAQFHSHQGTYAQLLCSLPSIALCSFDTNTVAAKKAPTFTFGNYDDGVFNNAACPLGSGRVQIRTDNTSSQIVETAQGGGLSAMGGNDPLLGSNPISSYSNCISNSHSQVFTVQAGSVAAIIGEQIGAP